ncbi:MAG: hypothetical protein HN576_15140 [Bacteriovoracaceae bacterium]|jgi:hypothetical protein|nr:hypothetical protein [Bacteriovoracaceae bacterium]
MSQFILLFICVSTYFSSPISVAEDSFNDMPPGLKEAWTNGTYVKQYYTDRTTGVVTVFSRPVKYSAVDRSKKKDESELPQSFGNSPKYLKKLGSKSICKSSYSKRPTFELPPEAFGKKCGGSYANKIAEQKRKSVSRYKIEQLTSSEYKKWRKKELKEAIPDHKLTWYELMKRKNIKEEKLNKIKAKIAVEEAYKARKAEQKLKSKPVRTYYSSYPRQSSFQRDNKKRSKSATKKNISKQKSSTGKMKGKVFGFSKKTPRSFGSSGINRTPTGNFSSSQSTSSTRMIYYSPNKSSSYEWGRNSKQIKR